MQALYDIDRDATRQLSHHPKIRVVRESVGFAVVSNSDDHEACLAVLEDGRLLMICEAEVQLFPSLAAYLS